MLSKSVVFAGSLAAGSASMTFIVSFSLSIGLYNDVDKREGSLRGITGWFSAIASRVILSCLSAKVIIGLISASLEFSIWVSVSGWVFRFAVSEDSYASSGVVGIIYEINSEESVDESSDFYVASGITGSRLLSLRRGDKKTYSSESFATF